MHSNSNSIISRFLKLEAAGGILLFIATLLAIVVANTFLEPYYQNFLNIPVQAKFGPLDIAKPLILWINDGLMAIFFFLIGLELKRELVEGELSDKKNIILPAAGAIGGMVFPALIYLYFNYTDSVAIKGWAIPAATDIAFALGVLTVLGKRVPLSLKIFLTSLAIFDDIGAIIIIALFYTTKISLVSLGVAALAIAVLAYLNKKSVSSFGPYALVGIVLWVAMLKSGVHATLAGVILAMFIPLKPLGQGESKRSLVKDLEHKLHSVVAFIILPIFAFSNAGIDLRGVTTEQIFHGVPVGIALGLFLGKQIGVFGFCWLAIKMKISDMPKGMNWLSLYGTAALCGIGFTMSLFVGSLAFTEEGLRLLFDERIGIVVGSLASGIVGFFLVKKSFKNPA